MTSRPPCQVNSAIPVKQNTPPFRRRCRAEAILFLLQIETKSPIFCIARVDKLYGSVIISLTRQTVLPHALLSFSHQDRSASPARPPASASGIGQRFLIPSTPVFRSAGQLTGQVRNAPPRAYRPRFDHRGGGFLRFFASFVLPSAGGFPATWTARPGPAQARSPRWAQADGRDHGFCRARVRCLTTAHHRRVGAANSARVWHPRASAQPATAVGAVKKTTLGSSRTLGNQEYARRYEQLRAGVIEGHALGPGYTVLCDHGLKTWMDHDPVLLTDPIPTSSPERRAALSPPARAEMLALLTTMLLQLQRREALS